MRYTRSLAAVPLVLLLGTSPARAEVENCMEIESLPATLATQGLYCLKHDLSTGLAAGAAIVVATNNVTLDCNGFKIGGLQAGPETRAIGIHVQARQNVVVRNCAVRGFFMGMSFDSGGNHVVEDNRVEASTYVGIFANATSGDILRRNHVTDIGGNVPMDIWPAGAAFGIAVASSDGVVLDDNMVSTVFAGPGVELPPTGIAVLDATGFVRDNLVGGILAEPGEMRFGINANLSSLVIRDNSVNDTWAPGYAIYGTASSYCADNHVRGFSTSIIHDCVDGGGNTP